MPRISRILSPVRQPGSIRSGPPARPAILRSNLHMAPEKVLTGIMNSALDGVALLRAVRNASGRVVDFRWIRINPEGREDLGLKADDLIGRKPADDVSGRRPRRTAWNAGRRRWTTGETAVAMSTGMRATRGSKAGSSIRWPRSMTAWPSPSATSRPGVTTRRPSRRPGGSGKARAGQDHLPGAGEPRTAYAAERRPVRARSASGSSGSGPRAFSWIPPSFRRAS